jgi:HEAT repeat protein
MKCTVIKFNSKDRILHRVRDYANNPTELERQPDRAIPLLFKALKVSDEDLRLKIVLMLGSMPRPQVLWPLYKVMHVADESEMVRQAAAIQLSVLGGTLKDTSALVEQLAEDLRHDDSFIRANAAFALGWEGNWDAAHLLIATLADTDSEVQYAAIHALANLHDDRVFGLLVQLLTEGGQEQKRAIIYNLCRFTTRRAEAVGIYERFIQYGDPRLRYDALIAFHAVAEPGHHLPLYRWCLADPDHRVRELALIQLLDAPTAELTALRHEVLAMTRDSHPGVRRAAVRLCHHIQPAAAI